ncbi:hypothetical protein FA09DRAFT_328246 [Tilletiopsis washingtonensis]|jgi:hypothetical protein|uniref:Ribosomal protein/NADH dehydrogenase domain-containing protein n=1 Tax=Tilletiopsis washingtonensis TaxID=58919 RepID=A0A316ZIJ0_9BASI|nr:hypothetical protein FA09DRAFT_328246 [Tilletiopsis washingtonensis]PWO00146.1 hypothetical protein FA09DRAFT_328246 [Tilletiopsis washingtonensis]
MSRPQTLPQLLARLSTGAGAHAMPTLASLHLSYPTTGAGSAGARRFAKQILPRLKFANPRVAVECDVWRPVATKGLAEEEVERVTKEAAEQGLDKRRAVMYVQFGKCRPMHAAGSGEVCSCFVLVPPCSKHVPHSRSTALHSGCTSC